MYQTNTPPTNVNQSETPPWIIHQSRPHRHRTPKHVQQLIMYHQGPKRVMLVSKSVVLEERKVKSQSVRHGGVPRCLAARRPGRKRRVSSTLSSLSNAKSESSAKSRHGETCGGLTLTELINIIITARRSGNGDDGRPRRPALRGFNGDDGRWWRVMIWGSEEEQNNDLRLLFDENGEFDEQSLIKIYIFSDFSQESKKLWNADNQNTF